VLAHGLVFGLVMFGLGTVLHELGHAVAIELGGGDVVEIRVLWFRVFPELGFVPSIESYGRVSWVGPVSRSAIAWVDVAGGGSTWLASLVALATWSRARATGLPRTAHLAVALFFADVVCHSLPWIGVPMYVLFGSTDPHKSEVVAGAVQLGLPEPLVVGVVLVQPVLAAAVLSAPSRRSRRRAPG
jgi:hypothetical protein